MQVAHVPAGLEGAEDPALQPRGIASHESEGLVGVDGENHMVIGLAGAVCEAEQNPLATPCHPVDGRAQMQPVPGRKTAAKGIDVCLGAVSKRAPPKPLGDGVEQAVLCPFRVNNKTRLSEGKTGVYMK